MQIFATNLYTQTPRGTHLRGVCFYLKAKICCKKIFVKTGFTLLCKELIFGVSDGFIVYFGLFVIDKLLLRIDFLWVE